MNACARKLANVVEITIKIENPTRRNAHLCRRDPHCIPPALAGWKPIPPSPLTYKAKSGAKPAKDDDSENDLISGDTLLDELVDDRGSAHRKKPQKKLVEQSLLQAKRDIANIDRQLGRELNDGGNQCANGSEAKDTHSLSKGGNLISKVGNELGAKVIAPIPTLNLDTKAKHKVDGYEQKRAYRVSALRQVRRNGTEDCRDKDPDG